MTDALTIGRPALVRKGLRLNYRTIAYNTVEAIVSLTAGIVAGSVALVGFGVDSGIEVTASLAAQWRLRADVEPNAGNGSSASAGVLSGFHFWHWQRMSRTRALGRC